MKAVVAAFTQEKALVGAVSVITNLRMELFEALMGTFIRIGSSQKGRDTDDQLVVIMRYHYSQPSHCSNYHISTISTISRMHDIFSPLTRH